jgi:hypothetical protein
MSVLIVLALLIALDVAAWFTGHDSRDGRDWSFRGWKVMTAARAMESDGDQAPVFTRVAQVEDRMHAVIEDLLPVGAMYGIKEAMST